MGLGVSIYLTIAHFNSKVALVCPENSTINCEKVTTSPESYFLHIPVAVLGLLFFVVFVLVNSPFGWRLRSLELPRFALSLLGVGFVLWLVYSEIVRIGAICLWCTSVHVITVSIFFILLYGRVTYVTSSDASA